MAITTVSSRPRHARRGPPTDSRGICVARLRRKRMRNEQRAHRQVLGLWLLTVLLAMLTTIQGAQAREVYRCQRGGGPVVFADKPCGAAADTRVLDLAEPTPPKKPSRAQLDEQRRIAAWERQSSAHLPPTLGGTPAKATTPAAPRAPPRATPKPVEDECARSRHAREQAYRERGNSMGFNERRALQDRMDMACAAP